MALIDPVLGIRIIFILGFTNLIALALVFFSCRCLLGRRVHKKLSSYKAYQKFYRYHCWYWWFFFASVLLHSVTALLVFGSPY